MSARLQGSSGNDSIQTPRALFARLDEAFQFQLDAFASFENHLVPTFSTVAGTFQCDRDGVRHALLAEQDGFAYPWAGRRVWVNPPYARLMEAVAKFESEVERADWIVMLVKVDHSTKWFQRLEECALIQHFKRRVKYEHQNPPSGWSGATFASCLAFPKRDWLAP